jgi:hypothetical protein
VEIFWQGKKSSDKNTDWLAVFNLAVWRVPRERKQKRERRSDVGSVFESNLIYSGFALKDFGLKRMSRFHFRLKTG